MSNKKKPSQAFYPAPSKTPKVGVPEDTERQTIKWSFIRFDNHIWHNDQYQFGPFNEIANHMKSYERMTWAQVRSGGGGRDHPIPVSKLTPEAQKRLQVLRVDDFDELWRFRFTGPKRIWGVKIGRVFHLLWWDPQHKVCPSELKHT
jgi:hypothetical protein